MTPGRRLRKDYVFQRDLNQQPGEVVEGKRVFLCGTRKIVIKRGWYEVQCASCEKSMAQFSFMRDAEDKCMRDSGTACRACGAA